jgi:hypothetical protein
VKNVVVSVSNSFQFCKHKKPATGRWSLASANVLKAVFLLADRRIRGAGRLLSTDVDRVGIGVDVVMVRAGSAGA